MSTENEVQPQEPKTSSANILKDNLAEALKMTLPFTAKHSTLPVLSHVLLDGNSGALVVSATNLDAWASVRVGSMADRDFKIAVPGKTFADVVNLLSDMIEMEMYHRTQILTLKSGIVTDKKKKTRIGQTNMIKAIDAQEFPQLRGGNLKIAEMSVADLRRIVTRAATAAAVDDARPMLNGIYLEFGANTLQATGCDGFRMAHDVAFITSHADPISCIAPTAPLKHFVEIADDDYPVEIYDNRDDKRRSYQIVFVAGPVTVGMQIIDGKYPDYHGVVPTRRPIHIVTNRADWLAALKAGLAFRKSSKDDRCQINIAQDDSFAHFDASDPELGDMDVEIPATLTGFRVFVQLNMKYLETVSKQTESDTVTLELAQSPDGIAPLMIQEGDFFQIVMPMAHDKGVALLEKPDYASLSEDELSAIKGRFSVTTKAQIIKNLLEAIDECREVATTCQIEAHVTDLRLGIPVWEVDGRE